jgi:dTDP-4-dehydrorhamnose reductase
MEGVWHVAGEPIDKHAFLLLAGERLGVDVGIRPVDGPAIDRTLDDARFREATGIPKPTWAAMLDEIAANAVPYDRIRGESR